MCAARRFQRRCGAVEKGVSVEGVNGAGLRRFEGVKDRGERQSKNGRFGVC